MTVFGKHSNELNWNCLFLHISLQEQKRQKSSAYSLWLSIWIGVSQELMRPLGVILHEKKCSLVLSQNSCVHFYHLIWTWAFFWGFLFKIYLWVCVKTILVFAPGRGKVFFCPVRNWFQQLHNRANILCLYFTWPLLLLSLSS